MRSLELRRHSFTKKGLSRGHGSHLSVEGVRAARRLGEGLGTFDYVVASTSPRTLETAVAMGCAVDELIEMTSPVETGEVEFHAWRGWANPFEVFRQMTTASPAFRAYARAKAAEVRVAVERLDDGCVLLAVGHGGWLEAIVSELVAPEYVHELGGSFWHLDGIRLVFTGSGPGAIEAVDRYPR